jgi:beta-lactamase superfamily II metal-dependent hydrolase
MTRTRFVCLLALVCLAAPALAQNRAARPLEIYVVDVEGGNATLFVTPSGETVLIDTGNGGAQAARDASRIVEAARDAGVTKIDHLIITHWHGDHFGGLQEVARQLPIAHYYDHGPNVQATPQTDDFFKTVYEPLTAKAQHTVVKPGDTIPVKDLKWTVVAAAGNVLKTNLSGAGKPNPYCAESKAQDPDPTENAQSVSSYITFGRFHVVHMGDLTYNRELDLMCPNNRLGSADLFLVSHHGQAISNSPALVHALHPRAAIINNGTRKGGQPDAMKVLFSSPGLEDVWQIHFSLLSGQEYTVPGTFIANQIDQPDTALPIAAWNPPPQGQQAPPAPVHNGKAYYFKIVAQQDGTFTVTNMRNNFSKTYRPGSSNATR